MSMTRKRFIALASSAAAVAVARPAKDVTLFRSDFNLQELRAGRPRKFGRPRPRFPSRVGRGSRSGRRL